MHTVSVPRRHFPVSRKPAPGTGSQRYLPAVPGHLPTYPSHGWMLRMCIRAFRGHCWWVAGTLPGWLFAPTARQYLPTYCAHAPPFLPRLSLTLLSLSLSHSRTHALEHALARNPLSLLFHSPPSPPPPPIRPIPPTLHPPLAVSFLLVAALRCASTTRGWRLAVLPPTHVIRRTVPVFPPLF